MTREMVAEVVDSVSPAVALDIFSAACRRSFTCRDSRLDWSKRTGGAAKRQTSAQKG
ncbi:unnamed protein product [Pylaiella littoralis]